LDNFQPYISSFTFNANGITQYTRNWSCSDCGISLTANPVLEANQSDWNAWLQNPNLLLSVRASEPLETLTLDIVVEGNVLQEDIQGIPFPNGIDWNFDISQYAPQLSGKVEFRFLGYDTNGNSLLSFSPSQQNTCVVVPTRSGADSWDNPDNVQSGQDNVHAVCIDCGGRSPDGDCAIIALVPDEECLEVEAEITNASGANANDGSINLTISGGALPYQFSWSNGSATEDISGLAPGSYVVTITDALCCTTTRRYNVTGCQRVSPAFVHGEVTEAGGAGNNGAIDITLININTSAPMSSSAFNFQWTGPNGFTSSNEDIAGLAPGNYCVEVRENRFDCLVTSRCFSVCGSMILGIQHNGFIDCEGERGTFELMLLEQNVAAPYEIQWSNGATSAVNENLVPGIYCATVTDANGCTDQACLKMRVNFPIELSGQVENAACNNANGSIVLMASSPNSEITAYEWSNGSTTQNLEGLAAGEYCVTVTNAKGCEKTACFTVENIELIVGLESIVNPFMCSEPPCVEEASCTSDGAIDIRVQSNVSGVTYQWSGPDGFNASSEDISGLTPGTYTVTASIGDCSISKSFNLHPCFEEEYVENNPYDPPGCETQANSYNFIAPDGAVSPVENGCDGSVELSYSGFGLYFSWSGPDGFVSSEKS
ncbi:MAG TPA: SprB repeat-containing protein, partial [Saprospiraceae bacterium]|nr:SprB repeat-containing protein [Saprospiraceae bacterium]